MAAGTTLKDWRARSSPPFRVGCREAPESRTVPDGDRISPSDGYKSECFGIPAPLAPSIVARWDCDTEYTASLLNPLRGALSAHQRVLWRRSARPWCRYRLPAPWPRRSPCGHRRRPGGSGIWDTPVRTTRTTRRICTTRQVVPTPILPDSDGLSEALTSLAPYSTCAPPSGGGFGRATGPLRISALPKLSPRWAGSSRVSMMGYRAATQSISASP